MTSASLVSAVTACMVGCCLALTPALPMAPAVPILPPPSGVGANAIFRRHLADYDAEIRGPDGRVDVDAMVARLKDLGVTTYYWLIWHAPTDWDDLQRFLPKADQAGITVWVYLVPPSESPPKYGNAYSEPFRLDYGRWAEEVARLSLRHRNLTGWVIDDFYANRALFTPAVVGGMRASARRINPRLAFLPLMYPNEIDPSFARDYGPVIDGVVVAYLQDREEIDSVWAILNDRVVVPPGELRFPWNKPSQAGDFVMASQPAAILPSPRYKLRFRERDDFTGPTSGYHIKQVLVDGQVVWEEDVAGGDPGWHNVTVDVTDRVRGKARVTLGLRIVDRKGVSNFGVRWRVSELRGDGIRAISGSADARSWAVSRRGAFEAGFGEASRPGRSRFHIPFVSMTAASADEFRQRHGAPASPERIAAWLRMSLQAWRDGKCDGVVTYCLDKGPRSLTFPLARRLMRQFGRRK